MLLGPTWAAGLFGGDVLRTVLEADPADPEQAGRLQERLRQQLAEEPVLPPYRRLGLGYRRGASPAERYWVFTLVYDDPSAAREAAPVLHDRIRRYRLIRTDQPLVGPHVAEVLPAVVRDDPAGAAVSLRLRLVEGTGITWLQLVAARDVGFLQPGQMIVLP
jgi:hypothetical protein